MTWQREPVVNFDGGKRKIVMLCICTHTHTFFCIDIDVYRCRCMHTETFRNCARVLVPNYLPKTWQSRQNFWRCLEDPGMITKPKNHSWHTKDCANGSKNWSLLISATCHLTLAFPVFFPCMQIHSPSKVFWGKNSPPPERFLVENQVQLAIVRTGSRQVRLGMGEPRVTRWVCFHGGFTWEHTNTPCRKKENHLPSKASFFRLYC